MLSRFRVASSELSVRDFSNMNVLRKQLPNLVAQTVLQTSKSLVHRTSSRKMVIKADAR
jgi:hypothetical protein